jgi:rubrerythrin
MVLAEKPTTQKLLDLAIFWKTQTSGYYEFLGRAVGDPILKQRFRLLAAEERDHRKILRKYRRDLCGRTTSRLATEETRPMEERFSFRAIFDQEDLKTAIRITCRAEEKSRDFFAQASAAIDNREGRIFLRLLSEEGTVHGGMLEEVLDYVDRKEVRITKAGQVLAARK